MILHVSMTDLAVNLCQYFAMVEAEIVECPDFRQHPFNFNVEGKVQSAEFS
jgi:hypothetical protein